MDPRDPRVAAGIRATTRRLRAIPGVAQVADPYEGPPELLARDGRAALVAVELAPGLDDDRFDRALDRAEAELLSMPVVLVLLLVVFGGIVAAGLPVLVALVGISAVTDVSVYSVNVAASLAGLLVFADPFLRSMAYGGGAVVLIVVVLAEAGTDPAGLARVTAFGDRSPGWTGSWPSASSGRWPKASRSWRSCPTAVGPTP